MISISNQLDFESNLFKNNLSKLKAPQFRGYQNLFLKLEHFLPVFKRAIKLSFSLEEKMLEYAQNAFSVLRLPVFKILLFTISCFALGVAILSVL